LPNVVVNGLESEKSRSATAELLLEDILGLVLLLLLFIFESMYKNSKNTHRIRMINFSNLTNLLNLALSRVPYAFLHNYNISKMIGCIFDNVKHNESSVSRRVD
jgi:mannose/fructose/N-acetylgalactosamine-specific phosphotransferase system component IIC